MSICSQGVWLRVAVVIGKGTFAFWKLGVVDFLADFFPPGSSLVRNQAALQESSASPQHQAVCEALNVSGLSPARWNSSIK